MSAAATAAGYLYASGKMRYFQRNAVPQVPCIDGRKESELSEVSPRSATPAVAKCDPPGKSTTSEYSLPAQPVGTAREVIVTYKRPRLLNK